MEQLRCRLKGPFEKVKGTGSYSCRIGSHKPLRWGLYNFNEKAPKISPGDFSRRLSQLSQFRFNTTKKGDSIQRVREISSYRGGTPSLDAIHCKASKRAVKVSPDLFTNNFKACLLCGKNKSWYPKLNKHHIAWSAC